MKALIKISKPDAERKLASYIQTELNALGLASWDVYSVDITTNESQLTNAEFLTNHKIRMIKFMRKVVEDTLANKIQLRDTRDITPDSPCPVGLGVAKAYVESYFV